MFPLTLLASKSATRIFAGPMQKMAVVSAIVVVRRSMGGMVAGVSQHARLARASSA